MPATATRPVGVIPSSIVNVIKQISFLKRHEVARPDGVPLSFFKHSGGVIEAELTKSLKSSLKNEQTSDGWSESVIEPVQTEGWKPTTQEYCSHHQALIQLQFGSPID